MPAEFWQTEQFADADALARPGQQRDLYYQLRPHAKVPAVHDFLERARGFVQA